MAVDAICPHCDTRFHLHADMQGQAVRCPECKDVFVVSGVLESKPPREVPYERIESAAPPVLVAEVLEPAAKPAAPPVAREVEWSRAARPPLRDVSTYEAPRPAVVEMELPKPPRNVWPLVLTGLIISILLLGGGAIAKLLYDRSRQEDFAAGDAAAAFKDRNYPEAAERYQKLLHDYPQSTATERYRFFETLSVLHAALSSASVKDDPSTARELWARFQNAFGTSPLTRPDESGFGVDVFDAGRKLLESLAGHADLRLNQFRGDRSRLERLTQAEAAEAETRALMPAVERYRPRDVPPLDEVAARLDALQRDFRWERRRLDVFAPYRDLAADPVEERIAEFEQVLARNRLSDDAEGQSLIAAAGEELRKLMSLTIDDRPQQPAESAPGPRTFVSAMPPAGMPALPAPAPDAMPETVTAVARGWLYALDFDRGSLKWSTRVGDAPAPLRAVLSEGGTELLLVPSLLEGRAAISARRLHNGEIVWQQPLEAPAAGSGAILGNRLYLPLANPGGTLVELDISTGHRLASFNFRQRLQGSVAAMPGSNCLAVVAEARRIFIMDTATIGPDGERRPMRLTAALRTNHPPLSIRVPPVLIGPVDGPPRTMVLIQHEGSRSTRVRAIAMPEAAAAAEAAPVESPAMDLAGATLPGHVVLPAACDGERIAMVTDLGTFAIYRTNAPGNLDGGLFALPAAGAAAETAEPHPGTAAFGDEESLWLFARGSRAHYQLAITADSGFRAVPRGTAVECGLPLHAPQHFPERNAIAITTRATGNDSVRLTLYDRTTGRARWECLLGGIAAAPPLTFGNDCVLIYENGSIERIPGNIGSSGDMLALPSTTPGESARVVAAERAAWCILPLEGGRVQVRHLDSEMQMRETIAALPAPLAGEPAILADTVVLPLADGFLYCFDSASRAFIAGPAWRHRGAAADARCLVACRGSEVFASDGLNRIGRWNWPRPAEWSAAGPGFELRAPAALPPAILQSGEQSMLLAADREGTVSCFRLDRPGEPLRRWRPGAEGEPVIPPGVPSHGFFLLPRPDAPPLAVYVAAGRSLVAIDIDRVEPAWVIAEPPGEFGWLDGVVRSGQLYVTDLAGHVLAIDAAGKVTARWAPLSRDRRPAAAAAPVGTQLILPLDDGTTALLPLTDNAP